MRTAIDTNIISALWSNEFNASEIGYRLGSAKEEGGLVVAAPVYVELLAYPKAAQTFVTDFLSKTGITIDFELKPVVWIEAGQRFSKYVDRRRRTIRESPKRLLADFIIGSHALVQADRLLTLDPSRYKQDFRELRII